MREVAANTYSFLKALKSSSITSRTLIIELDVIVNIVANRLDALPSARGLKERPGAFIQLLRIAVSAPNKVDQSVIWELIDIPLRHFSRLIVGFPGIGNNETISNLNQTSRRDQSRTNVAECIEVVAGSHARRELNAMARKKIMLP